MSAVSCCCKKLVMVMVLRRIWDTFLREERAILLKIGNWPTRWTKFTARLLLCRILKDNVNVNVIVEYLHAIT